MVFDDDVGKLSTSFTGEGGRDEWWVQKEKKNKKDNFGKLLDPRAISAQNRPSA